MTRPPLAITVDVEGVVESDEFRSVGLLDSVLESVGVPATLFITPSVVEQRTDLVAKWIEGPHSVGLHIHPGRIGGDSDWLETYDQGAIETFLIRSQQVFTEQLGVEPSLFRAGRWSFSPALLPALDKQGFTIDATLRSSTQQVPYAVGDATELPMTVVGNEPIRWALRSKGINGFPLHADAFLESAPHACVFYLMTAVALRSDRPYIMVSLHDYDLVNDERRKRTARYLAHLAEWTYPQTIDEIPLGEPLAKEQIV